MCHAQSTYQIGMSTSLPCLLKLTFYRMSSESGGGGVGGGGGGGGSAGATSLQNSSRGY